MYIQLYEAFRSKSFATVVAANADLPAAERLKPDDQKRDQWLVRFSKTVGNHLGPLFPARDVPTGASARASIEKLPPWMPR